MNKHLKLILVLLVLALTVTALAITVGASGTDTEPALSIKNLSISLENAIFMNFKVASTGINDPNTIELLLWKNVPEEYKKGSEDTALSTEGTETESGYEVFKYTDLAAKNMTEYVYVCAYASIDGKDVYSAPAKFSIAMYAYMQKNASTPDAELVALIDGMLDYGALAQTYFKHNTEFLANEATYQIRVTNGLLEDNFALGWYFEGQSFTLTANPAPDGKVFSHWENSAGENIGTTEVLACAATKVDTYTAVYKDDTRIPESSEGLEFSLNADGESYTVTGLGSCTDTEIVIGTYKGLPVTAIGKEAFKAKGITGVIINDCVKNIGVHAFYDCTSLTSVTIPDSVILIGAGPFANCTSLTSITVSDNNTAFKSIDGNLYSKDGKILVQYAAGKKDRIFTVPSSVTTIGNYAFFYHKSLTSLTIPDSVTSIGANAFYGCSSLTSATISNSLANIGANAFHGCSKLAKIYIANVDTWCNIAGLSNLTSYGTSGKQLYLKNELITELVIPSGVTSIDNYAFNRFTNLTSVTIPNSVTNIGDYAFSGCTSLASVNIGNSVTSIGDYAFSGCTSLTSVTIPNSVTNIGDYAFSGCTSLASNITIPDGVTSIGNHTFAGTNIASVTIPNSVTSISASAFQSCASLTSVTIPDSVTSIGANAFFLCSNLTCVTISNSVKTIERGAFHGCSNLSKLTLGNSLTNIGNSAFAECSSLVSVTIPDSVTSIGSYAFRRCTSLTSITVSNDNTSYKSIDGNLHSKDGKILIQYAAGEKDTNFTIPDCVTRIEYYAFDGCTSITGVIIPNSVTSIGNYAFLGCTSLTIYCEAENQPSGWNSNWNPSNCPVIWEYKAEAESSEGLDFSLNADGESYTVTGLGSCTDTEIVIGTYKGLPVTAIGSSAFSSKGITGVIIGDSVTSIGYHAFYNCDSLKSVTIGNSVTSIGESAFYNCDSLKSVTIPDSVTSIGYSAFSDCTSLTSVIIGNSVTSIGSDAFAGCSSLTSVIIPDSVTYVGEWAFAYCSSLTIYCEAACQPSVWHSYWNYSNCPVVWGYKAEEQN